MAAGTIEAGTVGAVRFETIGVVDGRDAIVIEHINRMARTSRPSGRPPSRDGTYRIVIEGNPDLTCELTVGKPETASDDGMVATTMRLVNAIPYVCDAPAGLTTLPRPPPHHPEARLPRLTPPTQVASHEYVSDDAFLTQPGTGGGSLGGAEGAGVGGGEGGLEGAVVEGVGDAGEETPRARSRRATCRRPGRR